MAVPPVHVRVPVQWPFIPMLRQPRLSAKDKRHNAIISGLCTDFSVFILELRKTRENSARRLSNEGFSTIHHLKWGPLPQNDVGRIAQLIRKGKEWKNVLA